MIPKKIHITWKTKNILDYDSLMINLGIKKLIDLNPSWTIEISDDLDLDYYLKNFLSVNDYKLIENKHPVEKSDLWRLYKIYLEGGLYIDLDRMCNQCLDDIIDSTTKWLLPTYLDHDFSHDFMCSEPYNPVYKETIECYLLRRRQGYENVYFLGPQTYMHCITKMLTGNVIDSNPGTEIFNKIRDKINQCNFIKTYRENPPYETIIYKNSNKNIDHEKIKRELYSDFNLRHWTNEW